MVNMAVVFIFVLPILLSLRHYGVTFSASVVPSLYVTKVYDCSAPFYDCLLSLRASTLSEYGHTCYVVGAAHPAVMLWSNCDRRLLFPSQPFRQRASRASLQAGGLLTLLLLCAGIEPNPGPPSCLKFGVLNTRSVLNKAVHLHDLIADRRLHIVALTETWMQSDAPAAIQLDTAPSGYQVIHRPRGSSSDRRGGGVALIYRDSIHMKVLDYGRSSTEFESLVVQLTSLSSPLIVACVYRPPGVVSHAFCNSLADLFDCLQLSNMRFVMCGDLNSPGMSTGTLDASVVGLLECSCLTQHVTVATHDGGGLLDVIITRDSDIRLVSGMLVQPVCFSDHHIVICQLNAAHVQCETIQYKFRDIRRMDREAFCNDIRRSALFDFSYDQSVDQYVQLFEEQISIILQRHAPVQFRSRRVGHNDCRWLSADARRAKQLCRQLERKFRRTGAASDKHEYRQAQRMARKAISRSRSDHLKSQFDEVVGDAAATWRLTRTVLHREQRPQLSDSECRSLVDGFSLFFVDKLLKIQDCIAASLRGLSGIAFTSRQHDGPILSSFVPVPLSEVHKILTSSLPAA